MRVGIRVFLVDDNDSFQQIPMTQYERLSHFDRKERFQQYADFLYLRFNIWRVLPWSNT